MKLKKEVKIVNESNLVLQLGILQCAVPGKDKYLIERLQQGDTEEKDLIALIMKKEDIGVIAASFGLGQFIIDYADYIEDSEEYYQIKN